MSDTCVTSHYKLSVILGHALPRLQSPLPSPDKAALSARTHLFSTEWSLLRRVRLACWMLF